MYSKAYCPLCDSVIDLQLIETHGRGSHPDKWLTLTWNSPLEFPETRTVDIAAQLDASADSL